jgi:hypothetical protein
MKTIISVTFLVLTAASAAAQSSSTPRSQADRWAPWMGCWQVAEESVQDAERLLADVAGTPSTSGRTTPGARVCVTPSADGGATMTTLVSSKPVLVETIVADGKARPLGDPSCRGSQQAEWSTLAPRIYARTEVTCGDRPTRMVSGLAAIVSGPMWLDIQTIESEGRKSLRVRRYRRAADQSGAAPASTARSLGTMPIGGKLSMTDIKEASTKVAPEALQAAVLELGAGGYDLNAKRLLELDDAGVPDSVIDLMVAMSFPNRFVVERQTATSGPGGFGGYGAYDGYGDSMWGPMALWPYYAHPGYYSSYYSPFGYGSWGYYDPYYYNTPGVIILNPGTGLGGTVPAEPSGDGRVVDGQGYTRIRRVQPETPSRAGNGGGGSVGTSSAGSSGSTGGSGSGGVSTGGYSGGGGGGERVAVPRPPGGN